MLLLMAKSVIISSTHFFVQPSFQNTPPFGVSNIPVLGGISGAFGIVDPSRHMNIPSNGKVTFECLSTIGSLLLGS